VLLGLLLVFGLDRAPGWPIGFGFTLVGLVFPIIAIFGHEPALTIDEVCVRYIRGKHVATIPRSEVTFYRYDRTNVSYVFFHGHDGVQIHKEFPISVPREEIERAMWVVGIPERDRRPAPFERLDTDRRPPQQPRRDILG
jgi:hypothetical protein